jgi:hypothetical protein
MAANTCSSSLPTQILSIQVPSNMCETHTKFTVNWLFKNSVIYAITRDFSLSEVGSFFFVTIREKSKTFLSLKSRSYDGDCIFYIYNVTSFPLFSFKKIITDKLFTDITIYKKNYSKAQFWQQAFRRRGWKLWRRLYLVSAGTVWTGSNAIFILAFQKSSGHLRVWKSNSWKYNLLPYLESS